MSAQYCILSHETSFRAADAHYLVIAQVRSEIEAALAGLSCEHNATNAFQLNVPDEVWCMIWGHLPMGDRISVARVCNSWRTLALATPRLWRDVEYRCESDALCECQPLTCDGFENLAHAALCISRSGVQPLSLSVDVCAIPGIYVLLGALREVIQPHLDRLVAPRFRADDAGARLVFFDENMGRLPVLRTLHLHVDGEDFFPSMRLAANRMQAPLHLPALQELDIRGAAKLSPPTLPMLVTLRYHYKDLEGLSDYLRGAPALEYLRLYMPSPDPNEEYADVYLDEYRRAGGHAAPSICVEATNLAPRSEAIVLAIFGTAARGELKLVYETLAPADDWNPSFSGLDILEHVASPDELSVLITDSDMDDVMNLTISVFGEGKKRTLVLPWVDSTVVDDCFGVCDRLAGPPRAIVLEAGMWHSFKFPPSVVAHLKTLSLHLSQGSRLLISPHSTGFPSLEELCFEGLVQDGESTVRFPIAPIFEAAIARLAREHNVSHAFHRSVPNEVWYAIWLLLPFCDRMNVPLVCHSWRALALLMPQLWSEIEYRCGPGGDCPCAPRVCDGHDNLSQVALCLERSGLQKLRLSAIVRGHPPRKSALAALRDALYPHLARLVVLRFRTNDPDVLRIFFVDGLHCLPVLRTLHIYYDRDHSAIRLSDWFDTGFLPAPTDLPQLQELDIRGGDKLPPQKLPALRTLRCEYAGATRIYDYLSNAPALECLHLSMDTQGFDFDKDLSPEWYRCVADLAARVPRVEIVNICLSSQEIVLAMFGVAELAHLKLEYMALRALHAYHPMHFSGLHALRQVICPDEVSVLASSSSTISPQRLILSAIGEGVSRTVVIPWDSETSISDAGVFEFCDTLAGPPRALAVDARLWHLLSLPKIVVDHLQSLTVQLTSGTTLCWRATARITDFLSLEELCIDGRTDAGEPSITVSLEVLQMFLLSLKPQGVLPRLILRHVEIKGDVNVLDRLCTNVVYH
ncbi:hypothetical protein AURDEDRAFT_183319 [Auricularia subglabra TFB-10046 SS5]|nr:hypothetical protein AURDEDRAFT_183319 [Auricularia subglabra TFB-10046 SS5]